MSGLYPLFLEPVDTQKFQQVFDHQIAWLQESLGDSNEIEHHRIIQNYALALAGFSTLMKDVGLDMAFRKEMKTKVRGYILLQVRKTAEIVANKSATLNAQGEMSGNQKLTHMLNTIARLTPRRGAAILHLNDERNFSVCTDIFNDGTFEAADMKSLFYDTKTKLYNKGVRRHRQWMFDDEKTDYDYYRRKSHDVMDYGMG